MDVDSVISRVEEERVHLQRELGCTSPTFISEHMQRLAQHVSSLESIIADEEEAYEVDLAKLIRKYTGDKLSLNAATVRSKNELAERSARLTKLTRITSSSWKLISASQSRMKHLVAEAKNQI